MILRKNDLQLYADDPILFGEHYPIINTFKIQNFEILHIWKFIRGVGGEGWMFQINKL